MQRTGIVLTGLIILTQFVMSSQADSQEILVITNNADSITVLTQREIRKIFLGHQTRWQDHSRIIIVTSTNQALNKIFIRKYIRKTPSQFKHWWRKKLFTGEGKLPKSFQNDEDVIQYVAANKGAVGYIFADSAHADVNIIQLSGDK